MSGSTQGILSASLGKALTLATSNHGDAEFATAGAPEFSRLGVRARRLAVRGVEIETSGNAVSLDLAEGDETGDCYVPARRADKVMSYRINGPFFFGVAASVSAVLDAIGPRPQVFILDLTGVPLADTAAAHALASFAVKAKKRKTRVFIVGANARVRGALEANGLSADLVEFAKDEFSARSRIEP